MYKILILLMIMTFSLQANSTSSSQKLSYEQSENLLQSIEKEAIYYGSGEKLVYVFLDPLCKFSRKFITTVANNPKMLLKYRYCIYLYSIPRLHSQSVVSAIYMSQDRVKTLLDIMLYKHSHSAFADSNTYSIVENIESVAKQIGVNKRPFLVVAK